MAIPPKNGKKKIVDVNSLIDDGDTMVDVNDLIDSDEKKNQSKNGAFTGLGGSTQSTSPLPLQNGNVPQETNTPDFNFNNTDDPAGNTLQQLQSKRLSIIDRNVSSDATHVFHNRNVNLVTGKPERTKDEAEINNIDSEINNVKQNTFPTPVDAQSYLRQKLVGKKVVKKNDVFQQPEIITPNSNLNDYNLQSIDGNIDKSNVTDRLAFDKIQKDANLNDAIGTSQSLNEAAIKYSASQNPAIKRQVDYLQNHGEKLPNAYEGQLISNFLNNPDLIKKAQNNPDLYKQYQETQRNLLIQYPEFAKKIVAVKVSQAREDAGLNNSYANIPTQESTDKVVQDLYDNGKLNAIEKSVYENQIRPSLGVMQSIGRGIGRLIPGVQAVVDKSPIETPGAVENFENTYVNTVQGIAKSLEDLPLSNVYGTNAQKLSNSLQNDYSNISINPVGAWHELGQSTGNMTGFVLPMIMGGTATKALGASAFSGEMITNGLMFEGNNKEAALKMFPENSSKQFMYTTLATAGDMMIGKLIPTGEAKKGISNLFKEDITKVINDFTEGNITAAVAKSTLLNKASEFIPKIIKGNINMGATMSGFGLFHNGLDAAFGGRDVSGEEVANEALQSFKSGFLGGTIISAMAANANNAKLNGSIIREMAENREHYANVLNDQSKLNPELKPENDLKIAHLNEAAIINKDLENSTLTDQQKEKYLIQGLSQKVWERKAENTNNSVLKESYLAKAKENEKNQINILDGKDKAVEHENFSQLKTEENGKSNEAQKTNEAKGQKNDVLKNEGVVDEAAPLEKAIGLLDEKIAEGNLGVFANMDKAETVKMIAEQAQNVSGGKVETGNTGDHYQSTVNQFGQPLVDAAIEIHPLESLLKTVVENKKSEPVDVSKNKNIEPTQQEIFDDIKNKKFTTVEYNYESDIPDVWKDKISSSGETNGKKIFRVTLPTSQFEYESKTGISKKVTDYPTERIERKTLPSVDVSTVEGKNEVAFNYNSADEFINSQTETKKELYTREGKQSYLQKQHENDIVYKNQTISVEDLDKGAQLNVAIEDIKEGGLAVSKDLPLVSYENGKYKIVDGRHRIAQNIVDGKKEIQVNVEDATNFTRDKLKNIFNEQKSSPKEIKSDKGIVVDKKTDVAVSSQKVKHPTINKLSTNIPYSEFTLENEKGTNKYGEPYNLDFTKRIKTDDGGVSGVEPLNQFKLNQGMDRYGNQYPKVHIILDENDALKYQDSYGKDAEGKKRYKNLKFRESFNEIAKKQRDAKEEVVLDFRKNEVENLKKSQQPTEQKTEKKVVVDKETENKKEEPKVGKFEAKAREIADKIKKAELPSWLINKDPNINKQGISSEDLQNALAEAVIKVGKLLDTGIEIGEAIRQGADKLIDFYTKGLGASKLKPDFEKQLRDGFDSHYRENVLGEEKTTQNAESEPPKPSIDNNIEIKSEGDGRNELKEMALNIPNDGQLREYASKGTIEKYHGETPENEQSITIQELTPALQHGEDMIAKAKEVFGEREYVDKTLQFIEESKVPTQSKALMYISLENDLARKKLANPESLDIQKQQDLVRSKSQAFLREASLAINFGRLRKIGEVGYDISKITDNFFSGKEKEAKAIIEKSIEADANTINKQAETAEAERIGIEQQINEAVESEIAKIHEKLPTERRRRADKAIEALEKFQQRIRSKTYDATIGVPVAIIDAGITIIKRAIKAGVNIADAIDLGIQHIKDKYGKEWVKEGEFKSDMIDGFRDEGVKKEANGTPNKIIKSALIDSGFGREINVTVNERDANGKTVKVDGKSVKVKETRNILDWKKLAGEEGSIDKMKAHVQDVLEKQGFTKEEISNIQKDLTEQYNDLRASVIEHSVNELNKRNKKVITPEQKSATRKLAELYNYGLFEKDPVQYDVVLAKAVGIDRLNPERFKQAHELGKALEIMFSTKFNGRRLNDLELKTAIQVVEEKMRIILHDEAGQHGNSSLKVADLVRTYMDATQRMVLNTLGQAVQNPLSGLEQTIISSADGLFSNSSTKELKAQKRKLAVSIYKDMVTAGGVNYGDVNTTFVSRGNLDAYINKLSDNKLFHAVASTIIGKTTLDAADSFFKAKLTDLKFTHNLIKVLTEGRLVNGKLVEGMSKQDAVNYVSEKLTGQSFEIAKKTAEQLIARVNSGGKKIVGDSEHFVNRLANDIVKAALINGKVITEEQVTAAYNAAYRSAGRNLGHVANNPISEGVQTLSAKIEKRINDAIKDKEYKKAAFLTYQSIFFRNLLNPFVGGGTNWVFLKLEKNGLGLFSGLYNGTASKLDLTSEVGLRNAEKALYEEARNRDAFMRGAIGGATSLITALLWFGVVSTDDYRKWRNKNKWATKYLDNITPEAALATMAAKNKELGYYLGTLVNKNEAYDKSAKVISSANKIFSSKKSSRSDTPSGGIGEAVGGNLGVPIPWRFVRDLQNIWLGAKGEEPYKISNKPSKTFWEGFFQTGMVDYIKNNPSLKK